MGDVLAALEALVFVGAVVLVGDGEGEIGLAVGGLLLIDAPQLREQNGVGGVFLSGQGLIVVLHEQIPVEAQTLVDVDPAVEPVIARMGAVGLIAAGGKIADERGRRIAVVGLREGKTGEEGPLGIDGAAAAGIRKQGAVIGLSLQGVEIGVGIGGEVDGLQLRQIREALQHGHHHVDPAVCGDGLIGKVRQKDLGSFLAVALRRGHDGRAHRMEEGIEEAVGGIVLRVLPDVEKTGVFLAVVQAVVRIPPDPGAGAEADTGGSGQQPHPPALFRHTAPGKEKQNGGADQNQSHGDVKPYGRDDGVVAHHAHALAQQEQIVDDEGLTAQGHLEVVDVAHDEQQHRGDQVAEPGAVGGEVEKEHQQRHRQEIQQQNDRLTEIGEEPVCGKVQGAGHQTHRRQTHCRQEQQDHRQGPFDLWGTLLGPPAAFQRGGCFFRVHFRTPASPAGSFSARRWADGSAPWCRGHGR